MNSRRTLEEGPLKTQSSQIKRSADDAMRAPTIFSRLVLTNYLRLTAGQPDRALASPPSQECHSLGGSTARQPRVQC